MTEHAHSTSETTQPEHDGGTVIVERLALILTATGTLAALLFSTREVMLGVAIGGVLGTLNFYALRWLMGGILRTQAPRRAEVIARAEAAGEETPAAKRSGLMMLLVLKFGVMGTVLFVVLRYVPLDGTAFIGGVSLVVFSIIAEGVRTMLRAPRAE